MPKEGGAPENAADSAMDEAPKRFRFRWQYLLLFGLNAGAFFVVAMLVLMHRSGGGPDSNVTATDPTPVDLMSTVAKGDELLLEGKPRVAIEKYALAVKSSELSSPLLYRMGVAAEHLGDFATALKYFRQADRRNIDETSFATQLGQARIHFRQGNITQSTKLLSSMAALSATPVYSETPVGAEVDYLMALGRTLDLLERLPKSQFALEHVFGANLPFHVDELISLVPREGNQADLQRPLGDDAQMGVQIHGVPREPSTTLMSAGFRNQPISVLLESLAAATGWKISLTDVAAQLVSAKRVEVYVRDKTVAELLSLVLEPQRLHWRLEGDTLLVDRFSMFSAAEATARQHARANALLLAALSENPDHPLAPHAYLALGNLAALEERNERAATFYREVGERYPQHRIAQTAMFNLAKMYHVNGELPEAVEAYYGVVDRRLGSELEPLAHLFLGRIHFDQGRLRKAKTDLSRSLGLTSQPAVAAIASMTLASAYLVEREPGDAGSANAVLMEAREALQAEQFRAAAIFLSTVTLYRAAFTADEVKRRGRELLGAAMKVDPASFFGDFGYLLVGDAFADLNVSKETVRCYQQGLDRPLAPSMRHRLLFSLAKEYRKQNADEETEAALRRLIAVDDRSWSAKGAIELADLLLELGNNDACRQLCRESLEKGYAESDNIELLRILGRVYEELGDHARAGLCFAGFLPSQTQDIAEVE